MGMFQEGLIGWSMEGTCFLYVNISLGFGCIFCIVERYPNIGYVGTFAQPLENIPAWL